MSLTIVEIKNAKPAASDYRLADSQGLFLYVTTAGGKFWRYRYRIGPKEKTLALGRYPEVGLVAAREAHYEARKLVSEGKDPALEKQKAKIARIEAAKVTFRKMADEWLAARGASQSPRHQPISRSTENQRYRRTCTPISASVSDYPMARFTAGISRRAGNPYRWMSKVPSRSMKRVSPAWLFWTASGSAFSWSPTSGKILPAEVWFGF